MRNTTNSRFVIFTLFFFAVALHSTQAQLLLSYPMNQTPVSTTNGVRDSATLLTTCWGTLKNTPLPTVDTGARTFTKNAWTFNNKAYIAVAPNTALNSLGDIANTPGITIGFWSKFPVPVNNQQYLHLKGTKETFSVAYTQPGLFQCSFGDGTNIPRTVISGTANGTTTGKLDYSQWHYFLVTFDFRRNSNNITYYEDGVKKGNAITYRPQYAFNSTLASGTLFSIGALTSAAHLFGGLMDEVVIYPNALTANEVTQLYTTGVITNCSPWTLVNVDQPKLVSPINSVNIHAKTGDDGLPAALTTRWRKVSGPGTVLFGDSTLANTTASFSEVGTYVIRSVVNDGALTDYDEATVVVMNNQAPSLAAWASKDTILLSNSTTTINLDGWVKDDGCPLVPGLATTSWSMVSGPASVSFGNSSAIGTTAIIPASEGTYTLRLTAFDGELSSTTDMKFYVVHNLQPNISAWVTQPIVQWPSATFSLSATASDDGYPAMPGALSYQWVKTKGPGTVTFSSPNALNTTATCSAPGLYRLKLSVMDGELSVSKELDVNLWENFPGCAPPKSMRRLTPTPTAYEHPRVLFTKLDRADLLIRTLNDSVVNDAMNGTYGLKADILGTIDNATSPIGLLFTSLALGDETVDTQSAVTNSDFYGHLQNACYVAWLYQDSPARLQQLATAVGTAAKVQYKWWLMGGVCYEKLAICYDLMYDWMSESQRSVTRKLISDMTFNKHTYGWGNPDYQRQNWMTEGMSVMLANYAIENEAGYNAQSTAETISQFKSYMTRWGLMENGFNGEGMGYFGFGMSNGSVGAYAIARRDTNVFVTTNLYKATNEGFYEMVPWEGTMLDHQDAAGWSGSYPSNFYWVQKFMFPEDPNVDLLYRYAIKPTASSVNNGVCFLRAIFGMKPMTTNNYALAAPQSGMNLSIMEPKRGFGATRTDWTPKAAQLDFDCRFDVFGTGHMHADRNNFTFIANGRQWITDPGYHITENDAHSTVLIDGLGQSGTSTNMHWPTVAGKFLDFQDEQVFTSFAGDAKHAYTYSVAGNNPQGNEPLSTLGIAGPLRFVDMWYKAPKVLTGQDKNLNNYMRVDPIKYNPVQRAFRSAMLVRGSKPYALITDDIQKDSITHTYEWSVNTCNANTGEYDMAMMAGATNTDAILYRTRDNADPRQPRLLVRVIDGKGDAVPIQLVDEVNALNNRVMRLVVSRSNIVAPDYKILLFPHYAGDALPTTTFDGTTLGITMSDGQKDNIVFSPNADGRNRVQLTRLSGQYVGTNSALTAPTNLLATKGDDKVALNWTAVTGAESYNVKRSTTSGGPYTTLVKNKANTNCLDTTSLINGQNYFYVVSAVNTAGESVNSAQVSVMPIAALPSAPDSISANAGDSQITLNWAAVAGAQTYTVKRSTISAGPYTNISTAISAASYTDKSASNGTTYYYVLTASSLAGESALSQQIRTQAVATDSVLSLPFLGSAINVPGVIEAEKFDAGGEGKGYHDLDAANSGGKYRLSEGVDVDSCSAGGYALTALNANEWMEYTINVALPLNYAFNLLVSSAVNSGKFHLEIDGLDKTGTISVPSTGSLNYYTTVVENVNLIAGQHHLRLVVESGDFNVDKILVLPDVSNPIYNLYGKYSGLVLGVKAAATTDAALIQQFTNTGASNMQWAVVPVSGALVPTQKLINVTSGKVMSIDGGIVTAYKNIVQNSFANISAQLWRMDKNPTIPGFYILSSPDGGEQVGLPANTTQGGQAGSHPGSTDVYSYYPSLVQYGQLPYKGKAFQLPCTIEAEDLDLGGEGLGYHDLDYNNSGIQYRCNEGVDIEANGSKGYDVTALKTGEWLEYTIYAPLVGDYPMAVSVAAAVSTGKFHVNIDGVDKTGAKSVNATGGSQVWTLLNDTLRALTPGYHKLRLVIDGDDFNIDNINISLPKAAVKQSQTLTFNALTDKLVGDVDFDLGAFASSALPVNYTLSVANVITINNGMAHFIGEGTVDITVTQEGNNLYLPAIAITRTLKVSKRTQSITFPDIPTKTMSNADFQLQASASSGLAVSYVSSNPSVATVSGSTVHIVGIGTADITASQPGNTIYTAATAVTKKLTVSMLTGSVKQMADTIEFRIFPNPVADKLTLSFPANQTFPVSISIYNGQSEKVLTKKFSNAEAVLDVRVLSSGIYVLQMNDVTKSVSKLFEKK